MVHHLVNRLPSRVSSHLFALLANPRVGRQRSQVVNHCHARRLNPLDIRLFNRTASLHRCRQKLPLFNLLTNLLHNQREVLPTLPADNQQSFQLSSQPRNPLVNLQENLADSLPVIRAGNQQLFPLLNRQSYRLCCPHLNQVVVLQANPRPNRLVNPHLNRLDCRHANRLEDRLLNLHDSL